MEDAMEDSNDHLRFNIIDIVKKTSRDGRKGRRVTTIGGVTISWWATYNDGTTWRDLIDDHGDGTASVKDGVRMADDGGLIPPSAPARKGFWD